MILLKRSANYYLPEQFIRNPLHPAYKEANSLISCHVICNLNNESDNPQILFHYLTSFGQVFYNQFAISFSIDNTSFIQLNSFAAINRFFIFKEAMNNIINHTKASEMVLKLTQQDNHLMFSLTGNGIRKEKEIEKSHHKLRNMEKRCLQHNFSFTTNHIKGVDTHVKIAVLIASQTS